MSRRTGFLVGAAVCLAMLVAGCGQRTALAPPTIEITLVPEAAEGGADRLVPIAGRVRGARPGTRIVLYARSAVWWVQPLGNEPFTAIAADGTWKNQTHLGTEYAALLVGPEFKPPPTVQELPSPGGPIAAVVIAKGTGELAQRPRRTITFSGYEWDIRQVSSDRGGANQYDAGNVWVDDKGHLHLKLTQRDGRWTSAEVTLTRSLGYGTYLFVVSDVSQLEPSATLSMLTWDDEAAAAESSRARHRDQPLGRCGVAQRAVRGPALLRRRQRRALRCAGRAADAFVALGARPGRVSHGQGHERRARRVARVHRRRPRPGQRAGPHEPLLLPILLHAAREGHGGRD